MDLMIAVHRHAILNVAQQGNSRSVAKDGNSCIRPPALHRRALLLERASPFVVQGQLRTWQCKAHLWRIRTRRRWCEALRSRYRGLEYERSGRRSRFLSLDAFG